MNRVIAPVWDMVRDDLVGMSSVLPLATFSELEQAEILTILNDCIANDRTLTRPLVKDIVDSFKEGKRTYDEIFSSLESEAENLDDKATSSKGIGTNREEGHERMKGNDSSEPSTREKNHSEDGQDKPRKTPTRKDEDKTCPSCGYSY